MTSSPHPRPTALAALVVAGLLVAPALRAEPIKKPSQDRLLQRAYQKEYAFLDAQKRALKARLDEVQARARNDQAALEKEHQALERALLADQVSADRLEERVRRASAEQEEDLGDDGASEVLDQLDTELRRLGLDAHVDGVRAPAGSAETDAAAARADLVRLEQGLTALVGALEREAGLVKAQGAFFDASGRRHQGEVIRLGGIAAFGASDTAAGALAPAGAGAFKLWPDLDEDAARALARGETPATVGLLLFESKDQALDAPKEKTVLEVVDSGGAIAWVIVGLGGFALLLIVARALLLLAFGRGRRRLLDEVLAVLERGDVDAARARLAGGGGSMARVLRATVAAFGASHQEREDRIDEAVLRAYPDLDRFGSLIVVLAAVAPLLGLLGTVTGMIATFDVITEFGTGDPRMLSGGISEALVTTELGLVVAIPSLLLGNLLLGWGERIKRDLDVGARAAANLALQRAAHRDAVHDSTPPQMSNIASLPLPGRAPERAPGLVRDHTAVG